LPKNKVGVGHISNLKFQLNFLELQRQSDGKDYIVGAQTTRINAYAEAKAEGVTE